MARPGNPFIPDNTEVATIATANAVTALTGDVTGTGPGSTATTLANTAVTPASYTNANITVDAKGRVTAAANGSAGGITALTGDVTASGSGSVAATLAAGSASVLNSGTLNAARLPALTGDVTTSAGSAATTLAAGSAAVLNSGTLLAARMPALTGDITTTVGTVATTLATGNAGNLNSGTLLAARMPALTGDITTSAGAVATTIGAGKVTLAMQANLANANVIGRFTSGTGVPEAVTMAQLRTLLGLDWNSVAVAGSAAQNLASTMTFPADGADLEFEGKIVGPNATITWTIELNALATNQASQIFGAETAASFTAQSTNIYIADDTTTASVYFYGRVVQIAGIERQIILHTFQISGSTVCFTTIARWNVTTAITALRVHASTGTGLGIGTTLRTRVA